MTYPGGKGGAGVFQTIINQQPPHSVYIEAFLGGGSVLLAKRPASTTIGIDADSAVIARWNGARGVEVVWDDAIGYLQKRRGSLTRDTLVYCDPPYVRSARRRAAATYKHEMTDAQHAQLLTVLQSLPCMVQISGYHSALYAKSLSKWRMIRYMAQTRRGLREECLWMNYPEPQALHDYTYLGGDYRDRERIKRKAARWARRVALLPDLERKAIFSEILHR